MVLFIMITSILFSCFSKGDNYINNKELIEYISDEKTDFPSLFSGIYLFCEIDKKEKKFQLLDSSMLFKAHDESYPNIDYKDFILKIFSNQLTIECMEAYECFILNDTITTEYSNTSFSVFVKKYTKIYENNVYILNRDLSPNIRLSVMYYMFLNGYYTSYDDVAGYYFSERMKNIPTREENIFLNEEK